MVPPGRRPVAAARGCCACKLHPKMFYEQDEEGWECQGCKELTHVPESQQFGAALSLCVYLNSFVSAPEQPTPAAASPAMLTPGSSTPRSPSTCFTAQPVPLLRSHKKAVKVNN